MMQIHFKKDKMTHTFSRIDGTDSPLRDQTVISLRLPFGGKYLWTDCNAYMGRCYFVSKFVIMTVNSLIFHFISILYSNLHQFKRELIGYLSE